MIQSFVRLQHVDAGFSPQNVLTMELSLPRARDPRGPERSAFVQRLVEDVSALSGVTSAGVVTHLPLAGGGMNYALAVEGYVAPDPRKALSADYRAVSPGYFAAMGIPLVRGRSFDARDTPTAPHVLIVNETVARRYFGDRDPLRRKLTLGFDDWTGEIVGVIRDVRHTALDAAVLDEVYGPYAQTPFWPFMSLALRSEGDPLTLSCTVTERTREIGVRMALGAQRHDVLQLVVKKGMRLTLAGLALGLAASLALARVLQGLLFGTSATDIKTLTWVALGLALIALAACWLPARRATRVDPLVAMRYE